MIDIAFSKLIIIGVVALVVIGPEKLPRVARTAGTLLGRAQRYIGDVKAEVSQQMNVDGLNEMKKSVEEAARSAQASLKKAEASVSKSLHDTNKEIEDVWNADDAKKPYVPNEPPVGKLESLTPEPVEAHGVPSVASAADDAAKTTQVQPSQPAPTTRAPFTPRPHKPVKAIKTQSEAQEGAPHGQARWRAQRAATPLWYKRQTRFRGALLSDAARYSRKIP